MKKYFLIFLLILVSALILKFSGLVKFQTKYQVPTKKENKTILVQEVSVVPIEVRPTSTPAQILPTPTPEETVLDIVYVEESRYYSISGNSESQLRDEMNKNRLTCEDAVTFDACTDWYIKWSYPRKIVDGKCYTGSVTISVDVKFTYPQWNVNNEVSSDLKDKWAKFVDALKLHENRHKEHAVNGGKQIREILNSLQGYSTCQELDNVVNQKGQDMLSKIRENDRAYDSQTNHGETEGAKFP